MCGMMEDWPQDAWMSIRRIYPLGYLPVKLMQLNTGFNNKFYVKIQKKSQRSIVPRYGLPGFVRLWHIKTSQKVNEKN